MKRPDAQLVGAMGETIVLYELMYRGWIPANVNSFVRNARNVDIIAIKGDRQVSLSVKTSGPNSATNFQLGGEPDTRVFNRHAGAQAQFVCFVVISPENSRQYETYVVPVDEAEQRVQEADKHWRNGTKRDGSPHKPGIRGIRMTGRDTEGNIANGFAEKWGLFRDNWEQLEGQHDH